MTEPRSAAHYEMRARIAKALGHPGRLLILDILGRRGHASVGELAELLPADQSTASRHLAQLRQVGVVGSRREGGQQLYSLRVKCLDGFWQCVEGVLAQQVSDHEAALGVERVALVRTDTLVRAEKPKRKRD